MTRSSASWRPNWPGCSRRALGTDVAIENLRALTGGASRTTWAFDAVTDEQRRSLILRTGPPDDVHAGMELEARAQAAAAAAGAPVPHILVADDSPAALGNPFLICDEIKGETIVRRIQRQLDGADGHAARTRLLQQCAQALAAIHRADARDPGPDPRGPTRRMARRGSTPWATPPPPSSGRFAGWPPTGRHRRRAVLVHGDFRMGNLIVDGSDLAAVLDWELVHVGEAYEDLAWFCIRAWRFGAPAGLGAGGLGSIESFLRAYEQASGTTVDRVAFHWWLVLATLRWGVICRYQAERHLSGQTPLGGAGDHRPSGLRDRVGPARPARRGSGRERRIRPPDRRPNWSPRSPNSSKPTCAEATDGQVNFHARVAANALRIVERELLDADDGGIPRGAGRPRLRRRRPAGRRDPGRRAWTGAADEVTACLRTLVRHRLAVAHPGYDSE